MRQHKPNAEVRKVEPVSGEGGGVKGKMNESEDDSPEKTAERWRRGEEKRGGG